MKPPVHQQEPLMVALRVRPLNVSETKTGATQIAHTVDKNLVVLMDPHDDSDDILRANRSREKRYVFDCAFDSLDSQTTVYNSTVGTKDVIGRVISGYNCTVFAYGATGTGKTYTMLGTSGEPGIMGLTLNDLFKRVNDTKDDAMYSITMAYLEIYNEMVRDLLNPGSGILELREDSNGEVNVSGLLEVETTSTAEIMGLLRVGNQRRTCEPTAVNKTSSRSHAVLRVIVESRSRKMNVKQAVSTGVLFLVDLAGSERAAVTQNRGKRMIEGAHINRSLLALANCINALVSNNTHYVNYRDSKLTRLLKDALGGNCVTVMIAHISPASTVFEESRNTLGYAERGKRIKNKTRQNIVDVNYHITQYWHIIDELNSKVESLQCKLDQQQSTTVRSETEGRDFPEVTELCGQLKVYSQEEKEIRQEILTLEYHLLQTAVKCQKHLICIREWEQTHHSSLAQSTPLELSAASEIFSAREEPSEIPRPSTLFPSLTEDCNTPSEEKHTGTKVVLRVDKPESSKRTTSCLEGPWESSPIDESSPADMQVRKDGTESNIIRKKLLKPLLFIPTTNPLLEGGLAITPDSGTSTEVPSDLPMEPFSVSNSREELASLVASKQRMEAQHCRLERRHQECRANMASIKEKISSFPDLLPIHKELIDLLYHSCELEASGVENGVAATLMSVQLGRHESHVDQLLKQSSLLMETVCNLQSAMTEHSVPIPINLGAQWLAERQRLLSAQVLAEKQMPLLSKEIQLPHLSRLSAKLYTTVTGSKSIDESVSRASEIIGSVQSPLTPVLALSDVQFLPSAVQSPDPDNIPSLSTSALAIAPKSFVIPSFLQLSSSSLTTDSETVTLPPIDTHNSSLVAVAAPITSLTCTSQVAKQTSTSTEEKNGTALSHILEAAQLAKLRYHQGSNSSGNRAPLSRKSPKQVLNRVVSFTTPRNSDNKTKYVVPESASCPATLSDFEGSETTESSSQLHVHSKSTSSVDSVISSKSHLNNKDSSKITFNRQTCAKVNSRTDIVQLLEPAGVTRDPMSRNIITMEQLMALTQSMRTKGKYGSFHSTPLHKGNSHHVPTMPNLGSRKIGMYAKTAMDQNLKLGGLTASKLPNVSSQSITSTSKVVTNIRTQPVKVSLPSLNSLQRGRRQTGPRRNLTKQRHQGQRKKELVVAKVCYAGDQFSNISSPYLTPLRLPYKQSQGLSRKRPSWSRGKLSPAKSSGVWK